jgi:hypothetical protein
MLYLYYKFIIAAEQLYKKREGIIKMRNSRGIQIKRANILLSKARKDIDKRALYPKIGTSYILGVDKGDERFGDMSAVAILEQYNNIIKVLGCGTGEDIDAAINKLKDECKDRSIDVDKLIELAKSVNVSGAYTLGMKYRDMEDMRPNTMPKPDLLFHSNYPFISEDPTFNLVKKRIKDGNITEKPKCFNKCVDQYCNMQEEHCSNRDFPPMSKCTRCDFWFTNLERKEYQKIKDRHLSRIMDEVTIFRGE